MQSQQRVAAATAAGKYAEEIVPFTTTMKVTDKATQTSHEREVTLDRDEGPRPDTTLAGARHAQARLPRRHDHRRQRLAALRRRRRRVVMMDADAGGAPRPADPRSLPRHAARRRRARGDEHRDRAGDPEAAEAPRRSRRPTSTSGSCTRPTPSPRSTTRRSSRRRGRPRTSTAARCALGHPYGMSGIRYLGSTLLELGRRKARRAVVGVCTAGGMATAAYLEAP